jgi:hypothetical protein
METSLCLLDYSGSPTFVSTIGRSVKALDHERDKSGPPLVLVVDYADLLQSWDAEGERFRVTDIFKALRRLANKHQAILLTATQGDADTWERKYPTLHNLSEAKIGKAGTADLVVFWSQLPEEKLSGSGRLVVAKARGRKLSEPIIKCRVNWDNFTISGG